MKILKGFMLCFLLTGFLQANAQYNTGDDDLNRTLISVDAEASVSFGAFRADISGRYNVTEKKIDYLSASVGMTAGDIYMAVEIARITGKTIDQVVVVYQNDRGKGWGAMAKELGIKPGSPEFHALKGNAKSKGPMGNQGNNGKGKSK
jgi:hypothetical protein